MVKKLFYVVAIIQTVLHYLGLFGIFLGVVVLIFNNVNRGIELLIGGITFIILKYLIGIFYLVLSVRKDKEKS
jgi:cbb3-type cytochrome oxidase subunit 3